MFENIKQLRPYFFSLREIDVNVSLDLKLPITWTYDKIIGQYSSIKFKVQDKNEKHNLVSLISDATQEGYDVVFACSLEILNFLSDNIHLINSNCPFLIASSKMISPSTEMSAPFDTNHFANSKLSDLQAFFK